MIDRHFNQMPVDHIYDKSSFKSRLKVFKCHCLKHPNYADPLWWKNFDSLEIWQIKNGLRGLKM
jgi:hypothetical protein